MNRHVFALLVVILAMVGTGVLSACYFDQNPIETQPDGAIPEGAIDQTTPAPSSGASTMIPTGTATAIGNLTPTAVVRVMLPSVAGGATPTPAAVPPPVVRPIEPAGPARTPTPVATPTPRPPMRETKLGVGVYDGGDRMIQALDTFRPSVILIMDPNPDWARRVRKMFPKAFIIGRVFTREQPLDNPAAQGVAYADRVAEHAVPLKGVIDAWMSYNEVTDRTRKESYVAYNAFQVAFAQRLQDHYGIPAVAGNDASATVEPADYATYFRGAIEASAYFGIHLYAPKGINSFHHPDGRHVMLRYREIKAELDKAGVKHGPFVITEAGLWDGWREAATEQQMADDFMWYADELAHDSYVKGVTIYGLFDWERRDWYGFNIYATSIMDRIGEYNTERPS